MLTDAELVASARSGDRGALSEIYGGYADRLYDLCTSVLRDSEDAFDAMVDTFVLAALELYRLRRREKIGRQLSALLVARLARPGCPQMKQLIAGEDEAHPDKWLRHVAAHVDVCRTCSLWREGQPNAIRLIGEVPAEPAPPEVRDEVLDRVDLLWSVLGPPELTAAVPRHPPPHAPT